MQLFVLFVCVCLWDDGTKVGKKWEAPRATRLHYGCNILMIHSKYQVKIWTCKINLSTVDYLISKRSIVEWVKVAQSCLTLWDLMDCNPPGSSVHGILQARIGEWVAIAFSRGSSPPRDQTWVSCILGRFFTI